METTLTGKPNKRKAEALSNPLWNAGLYSQIVYFKNGRNKHCELALTTSKEQHDMIIESCKRMDYSHDIFYLYSNS
jgi:hypothetical protein